MDRLLARFDAITARQGGQRPLTFPMTKAEVHWYLEHVLCGPLEICGVPVVVVGDADTDTSTPGTDAA